LVVTAAGGAVPERGGPAGSNQQGPPTRGAAVHAERVHGQHISTHLLPALLRPARQQCQLLILAAAASARGQQASFAFNEPTLDREVRVIFEIAS
jgi:hypothetical protein